MALKNTSHRKAARRKAAIERAFNTLLTFKDGKPLEQPNPDPNVCALKNSYISIQGIYAFGIREGGIWWIGVDYDKDTWRPARPASEEELDKYLGHSDS